MSNKVSTPKGTRDYFPHQVMKRNYIFDTIRKRFENFGYAPIETPSFEYSSTLLGKYGDEGDRLVFRLLNSGDKVKKADIRSLEESNLGAFVDSISEKALRYDLTVPFARFIVEHQNEISFPFKRYQIQPVWRADRPQHGRYQEFYQCDADVVGSNSLLYEVEQIKLFDNILSDLRIPSFNIHINNRKVLNGIAEILECSNRFYEWVNILDKIDKIELKGVISELEMKGFERKVILGIEKLFTATGSNESFLETLKEFLKESEIGKEGLLELEFILHQVEKNYHFRNGRILLNISLARGLNYYTGTIFEVTINDVKMGSVCGGGRYDNLTQTFGLSGVSGIGISFGADRIYDVLESLNLFPDFNKGKTKVLITRLEDSEIDSLIQIQDLLRNNEIFCEIYSKQTKIQKQMKYANDQQFTHVIFQGISEFKNNSVALKKLETGAQSVFNLTMLLDEIKS